MLRTNVAGARGEYAPSASTRVTLEAARTVLPSFLAGEMNRQTLMRAGLGQRIVGRIHLNATLLRRNQDYVPANSAAPVARSDHSRTLDLAVSCGLLRRLNLSLLHRTTRNTSSLAGHAFRSRQFGAELGARF